MTKVFARESVGGAYAQYTFNLDNKFVLMAGLRGDHSSEYGFFVTPRAHIKYNPNDFVHFRLPPERDVSPTMCLPRIII